MINLFPKSIVFVNRNSFGSVEFVVTIFVAGVGNGYAQALLLVLVARDAAALLVRLRGPHDQLNFWDLHWSGFLDGSLVAVACVVPISLVCLPGLGCGRPHPERLTSLFCTWS